ncbi:MAG TPA: DUF6010 family protein [Longimicrobiaceae bacterium]|nr:DUF6010 family protein [Longimicrobiaceae bacterium]
MHTELRAREHHLHGPLWKPAALGVALALPFVPLAILLPLHAADLLALFLAATAGVYVGMAINDGRRTILWLELLPAAATFAFAALGLWGPTWWTAVGFLFHGAWDVLHHSYTVKTDVRWYFPPFCAAFDWAVAAVILLFLFG